MKYKFIIVKNNNKINQGKNYSWNIANVYMDHIACGFVEINNINCVKK